MPSPPSKKRKRKALNKSGSQMLVPFHFPVLSPVVAPGPYIECVDVVHCADTQTWKIKMTLASGPDRHLQHCSRRQYA